MLLQQQHDDPDLEDVGTDDAKDPRATQVDLRGERNPS